MESLSLTGLADEHLGKARASSAGRSAHTIHGGHDHLLRQTVIALAAGRELGEHDSPGQATLQVLRGRVVDIGAVPEPGSLLLVLMGAGVWAVSGPAPSKNPQMKRLGK